MARAWEKNQIVDTLVPIVFLVSILGGFYGLARIINGRRGGYLQLAICAAIFILTALLAPFLYSL